MNYLILLAAILSEAFGTVMLKMVRNLKDVTHIRGCVLGSGLGMLGYLYSLKNLGLSTTSAFWNGLGITCTTLAGVYIFHEKMTTGRVVGILMIITGCIVLSIANQRIS